MKPQALKMIANICRRLFRSKCFRYCFVFFVFFLNKEFCLNIDVVPIYRNIITRFLSNMLFFREPFPPIDLHRFLSSACAPGNETTTSA